MTEGFGDGGGFSEETGAQAVLRAEDEVMRWPVNRGIVSFEPGDTEDDRIVAKGGDVERNGFGVSVSGDGEGQWRGVMRDDSGCDRAAVDDLEGARGVLGDNWNRVRTDEGRVDEVGGSAAVEKCIGIEGGGSEGDGKGKDDVIFLVKGSRGDVVGGEAVEQVGG